MNMFATTWAPPLALTFLLLANVAANAGPTYLVSGRAAQDMAQQCYNPSSSDPQYVISICTRVIDETVLSGEPWAYATRAVAYIRSGNFDLAITDLDQAIHASPRDYQYLPDYFQYRCLTQLNRGEAQDALEDCNVSLKLRPKDATTLEFRGDVQVALKNYPAAIADLDATLAIHPENAGARYVRGLARTRSGDAQGGAADIAAARAKKPDVAKDYPGM
ncbi:MAG TPA: tetratricopeptide repeat protein [Rhodanobacteraceae bacterium]|nr:tetratricopeptide repeat protein [Rhodanobacteraceae bacterium]